MFTALLKFVSLQQLAALLIARQVIGNFKESALPYLLERMRQAKMSFDMWGALSPLTTKAPPGLEEKTPDSTTLDEETEPPSEKRTMSQAELESTLYKVRFFYNLLSFLKIRLIFSMMERSRIIWR